MENKISFEIQWKRTLILLAVSIFSGIVFFFVGQMSVEPKLLVQDTPVPTLQSQDLVNTPSQVNNIPTSDPSVIYKQVSLYGLAFDVPSTWSVFDGGDVVIPDTTFSDILISVGEQNVAIGDINWSQVDFSVSNGEYKDDMALAIAEGGILSKEVVSGVNVDVITFPLDNGVATKGGTGGKIYYFSMSDSNHYFKTLKIWKQAQAEPSFEDGFAHLIQTFKIVMPEQAHYF